MARSGIEIGFLLDRQWHWLQGEREQTKGPALLLVGRVLAEAASPYAVIGGVALQVHHPDPRTTLDVDLAVLSLDQIPRAALEAAGVRFGARDEHSENWLGPEDTPIQFSGSDPARRRSKRLQDLADAQALIEVDPALFGGLSDAERGILDRLPE